MAKSLLDILSTPFPKPTTRYPNQEGMTPLAGEDGIKAILKQLPIAAHPDPYGNEGFSADKYKAFDREKNRYGYNYSAKNDYNNQRPTFPLANPILNVNPTGANSNNPAFEAVDSVGMGVKVHYRVLNKLTNEYVTRQIEKTQAEEIAKELNHEYVQMIAEANMDLVELSNKTYGSYIKKASRELRNSNNFEGSKNRTAGIKRASKGMIGSGDAASRPRNEEAGDGSGPMSDGSVNKPSGLKPLGKGLGKGPKKLKEIFNVRS